MMERLLELIGSFFHAYFCKEKVQMGLMIGEIKDVTLHLVVNSRHLIKA